MKNIILLSILSLFSIPAMSACYIDLDVKNTGERSIEITNNWISALKVKGGTWRTLKNAWWFYYDSTITVAAGDREGDQLRTTFGCNAKRRYRINYKCKGGQYAGRSFTKYFPSTSGWTTDQSPLIKISKCKN